MVLYATHNSDMFMRTAAYAREWLVHCDCCRSCWTATDHSSPGQLVCGLSEAVGITVVEECLTYNRKSASLLECPTCFRSLTGKQMKRTYRMILFYHL
jgi:hypothetical protein